VSVPGGLRPVIAEVVDRALHGVALRPPYEVRPDVRRLAEAAPVIDLLVGTPMFRADLLAPRRRGHVDLRRLEAGGVDVVGLTVVTRFPDRRGTLSLPHFWSLGMPAGAQRSDLAILRFFAARIAGWAARSGGRLVLIRSGPDLDRVLAPAGPVGAYLALQGGQVLERDAGNVAILRDLGTRSLALAHVQDNDLVGSNTGLRRGPLTPLGREVVAEMERQRVVVDLAHMSSAGIRSTVPLLRSPFLLSHTGFRALSARSSSCRRYSAANRNVATDDARLVADAGGVVGITLSTQLLGGESLGTWVATVQWAVDELGPSQVAIGSDFDGGLAMLLDAGGVPLLAQALLDAGLGEDVVRAVLGGNALRVLEPALR
jgi:membrane dipeptidase